MINHPAELALHSYLNKVARGEAGMTQETVDKICGLIAKSLNRQFNEDRAGGDKFSLRISNIGRPYCRLWYEKNKPETALPDSSSHILNMTVGDMVEAVFYGVLDEAGVDYDPQKKVVLQLGDYTINGTSDMELDGKVDDIKSASGWSFNNKFLSASKVAYEDDFGYVGQLVGYSKAGDKETGGWWVLNKNSGEFKYVPYDLANEEEVLEGIKAKLDMLMGGGEFFRCYEAEPETYRKVPSGNLKLPHSCEWCPFREDCWEGQIVQRESFVSQAKEKPQVQYVYIDPQYEDG